MMKNLNIPGIQPTDGRQLDILATGLGSIPLCADVALRSPLSALGFQHTNAATEDGSTFNKAYAEKKTTCREICESDPRAV